MAELPMSRLTDTRASSLQRFQASNRPTPSQVGANVARTALSTLGPRVTTSQQPQPMAKTTKPKKTGLSKAEKEYQKQVNKAIEGSFQSGMQYLTGQEQRLGAFQPQLEQQIVSGFEAQVPQIQRVAEEQKAQIAGQQEETRAQRESALAQARRQFEEATQRTQNLFGGVAGSSAGLAQSELLAREQARQMGATTRQAQQNILGLQENLRNVEATTAQQLRQVEQEKQNALLKSRDQFRQQLETINQQRFQLAQDKANRQLQALQDFNSRRRQLEDYYTQQQDAIANLRTQAQIGLENYAQQLQIAQRFQPAQQQVSSLANLAGVNLEALNRTNPQQAQSLAREIATNPTLLQQFRANVSGNQLQFVTPEGNFGTIQLQ